MLNGIITKQEAYNILQTLIMITDVLFLICLFILILFTTKFIVKIFKHILK